MIARGGDRNAHLGLKPLRHCKPLSGSVRFRGSAAPRNFGAMARRTNHVDAYGTDSRLGAAEVLREIDRQLAAISARHEGVSVWQ
jgi:hypothetical protein